METVLISTLVVVLLVLTGAVVPLLVQLRRTAVAVERLAQSAAVDLKQAAEDVHALRMQAELLTDSFHLNAPGGGARGLFGGLQGGGLEGWLAVLSGLVGLLGRIFGPKENPKPED